MKYICALNTKLMDDERIQTNKSIENYHFGLSTLHL